MSGAYYNEIDPYTADWLRGLIAAGAIAPGEVDERSIKDVSPDDLRGFTQCHFFAGIGVWSYAARLAGWEDSRPMWTGSCPCQPFSVAGKGLGFDDPRHLWPDWFRLIDACRPESVFGEQAASKDGLAWLDSVFSDLENASYACGAVDSCAAGFGAPHARQRIYFVGSTRLLGNARRARLEGYWPDSAAQRRDAAQRSIAAPSVPSGMADSNGVTSGLDRSPSAGGSSRGGEGETQREDRQRIRAGSYGSFNAGGLADSDGRHASAGREQRSGQHGLEPQDSSACSVADADNAGRRASVAAGHNVDGAEAGRHEGASFARAHGAANKLADSASLRRIDGEQLHADGPGSESLKSFARWTRRDAEISGGLPGPVNGIWRASDWLACTDSKWRPVEPGTFPLAARLADDLEQDGAEDAAPTQKRKRRRDSRIAQIRGYGNALNAEQAAHFIAAAIEAGV